MKWKLAAVLIVTAAPLSAETAKIPGHEWVTVKNLSPISSGNSSFAFGGTCSIELGGSAIKIAEDVTTNRVLVSYDVSKTAYGASCPVGTLFELPRDQFANMSAQADKVIADDQNERARIARLLGK